MSRNHQPTLRPRGMLWMRLYVGPATSRGADVRTCSASRHRCGVRGRMVRLRPAPSAASRRPAPGSSDAGRPIHGPALDHQARQPRNGGPVEFMRVDLPGLHRRRPIASPAPPPASIRRPHGGVAPGGLSLQSVHHGEFGRTVRDRRIDGRHTSAHCDPPGHRPEFSRWPPRPATAASPCTPVNRILA